MKRWKLYSTCSLVLCSAFILPITITSCNNQNSSLKLLSSQWADDVITLTANKDCQWGIEWAGGSKLVGPCFAVSSAMPVSGGSGWEIYFSLKDFNTKKSMADQAIRCWWFAYCDN